MFGNKLNRIFCLLERFIKLVTNDEVWFKKFRFVSREKQSPKVNMSTILLWNFINVLYHRTDPRNTPFTHRKFALKHQRIKFPAARLGKLEASVAGDCVTKLITQGAFLLIIWQPAKTERQSINRFLQQRLRFPLNAIDKFARRHRTSYFKRLKQVELLGSLSSGSRFLIVKNPRITLPMVSPNEKFMN